MKQTTERIGNVTAKVRIERLRPDQITTDPRVQRPPDQNRVSRIVAAYDQNALGVPSVSRRDDGTLICLDGQTRTAALVQLNKGHEHISYRVFEGLTLAQEAHLFRLLNDFKRPTPLDLFRIAVTEGEPIALACDKMLTVSGFTSLTGHRNSFRAVNTLTKHYERDPLSVKRTLFVVTRAWGATRDSADGRLFAGLGDLMFRYAERIEAEKLADRLAKEAGGPPAYVGRARGLAAMRRIALPDAVADIAVNLYNKGRRTGVLPGWETT